MILTFINQKLPGLAPQSVLVLLTGLSADVHRGTVLALRKPLALTRLLSHVCDSV